MRVCSLSRHLSAVTLFIIAISTPLWAQETLLPLQWRAVPEPTQCKGGTKAVTLPFFDDFSSLNAVPSPTLWMAGGTLTGVGSGKLPPTVGMATLDALDADGRLYAQASTSPFGADTLESLPVRLDGLTASDSVVLSFYYLPGGGSGNMWERIGDTPGKTDSLYLEFYNPHQKEWHTVWSTGGISADSLEALTGLQWQYVAVKVGDEDYLDSAFRFRFRNLCSLENTTKPGLAGNCDQWNVDYIYLDRGRSIQPRPAFRDMAFSNPAPSMLRDYQAVPARQYTPELMKDRLQMDIVNLFGSTMASQYRYAVVDARGDTLYRYNGGYENAPAYLPGGTFQTADAHAHPPVEYAFPAMADTTSYTIVHTIRESVGGDVHPQNDRVTFRQVFGDYYAYDDGTAENGYGITSSSSKTFLAVRFDLAQEDTLTAIDLYFNRTLNGENEHIYFRITVWDNIGGRPGNVLYRDEQSRTAHFKGLNRFQRYRLDDAVVVNGSIFVGLEQQGNHYLNLGYDRHTNSAERIFYLTGNEWQQSILSGSLLLRPYFGASAAVGINGNTTTKKQCHVWPNPATDAMQIEGLQVGSLVQMFNLQGHEIYSQRTTTGNLHVVTEGLAAGVYLLRVTNTEGHCENIKVIIQH